MDEAEPNDQAEANELPDELAGEKLVALTMLTGLVEGTMPPEELFPAYDAADPTLVYFLFKWIKKHYNRDHEDSEFVRGNLKNLTNSYRSLTRKAKQGEEDPIVDWLEGHYKYSELAADEFVDLVIEKLEG